MSPLKITLENPIPCPCCQQAVAAPTLEIVIDRFGLTSLEGKILTAIWKGRGMPVMTNRIFYYMYADDPDGGPENSKMYLSFKVALFHMRQKLAGSGIGIENVGYRLGYRLVIGSNC